jgi:hypothetical protein
MNELSIYRERDRVRYNFTKKICISTYRAVSSCADIDSGNSKTDVFDNVDESEWVDGSTGMITTSIVS